MKKRKGYLIILTGDGKGKTTSALGMGMRAAGQGLRVIMLQFIKGSWKYGELKAAKCLNPLFILRTLGTGFIHINPENPEPADVKTALIGWNTCKETLFSGNYEMVILDEINNAISYGLLPVEEVAEALCSRPSGLHVVLTGRGAHPRLLELADLVTEMKELKHPYQKGITSLRGIEY